jgi:hypothetical protein
MHSEITTDILLANQKHFPCIAIDGSTIEFDQIDVLSEQKRKTLNSLKPNQKIDQL